MEELYLDISQWLVEGDSSILLAVNGMHSSYFDTFMWLCSRKFEWIPFYLSIIYVLFRNFNWRVVLYSLVAMGVILLLTDAVSSHFIRPVVARLRPSNLENPISEMIHIVDNHRGGRYGFPSSHASTSWGLVFFVGLLLRRRVLTTFLACWALLLCYSRLYLGVHYPGDLLAGMMLGAVVASVVYYVFWRTTKVEPPSDMNHPYMPIAVGLLTLVVFLLLPLVLHIS